MTFYIKGHRFGYELQRLAQVFFFGEKIEMAEGAPDDGAEGEYLYALLDGQRLLLRARLRARVQSGLFTDTESWEDKKPVVILLEDCAGPDDPPKLLEHKFAVLLYGLLSQLTGLTPQWGVLTGIRPVRLFLTQLENGLEETALHRHCTDRTAAARPALGSGLFALCVDPVLPDPMLLLFVRFALDRPGGKADSSLSRPAL